MSSILPVALSVRLLDVLVELEVKKEEGKGDPSVIEMELDIFYRQLGLEAVQVYRNHHIER